MNISLFFVFISLIFSSLRNVDTKPDAWQVETLQLVNEARSKGCLCGNTWMRPAAPLKLSAVLSKVAAEHAQYLRSKNRISHRGKGGTNVGQRTTQAGYRWQYVGENIAMGYITPAANIAAWLHSPDHCANIMDPVYTEMGIARAGNVYVQVLARPME